MKLHDLKFKWKVYSPRKIKLEAQLRKKLFIYWLSKDSNQPSGSFSANLSCAASIQTPSVLERLIDEGKSLLIIRVNLRRGRVVPPNTTIVNNTIPNVVDRITAPCLPWTLRARAKAIAPRRPVNHMINCDWEFIFTFRNLFTTQAKGKIFTALPTKHKIYRQLRNDFSGLSLLLSALPISWWVGIIWNHGNSFSWNCDGSLHTFQSEPDHTNYGTTVFQNAFIYCGDTSLFLSGACCF